MIDIIALSRCKHIKGTIKYPLETCPICNGVGYVIEEENNDIVLDSVFRLKTIEGVEKMKYNIIKLLLTEKGRYLGDPQYGSNLQYLIGNKLNSNLLSKIQKEIIEALKYYNSLQRNNPNLAEQIDVLESLELSIDDTRLNITISVINKVGEKVTFAIKL